MTKEHIFALMNKNPVFFLATAEGTQPHVRGMLLYRADAEGIVFHTGPMKDVYRQIMDNPKAEMCFYDQERGVQARVRGVLQRVDDDALKEEISSHPTRAFMQGWKAGSATLEAFYQMFSVFRLKDGVANVWTFDANSAPKPEITL